MHRVLAFVAFLFSPAVSPAGSCIVPVFENFAPSNVAGRSANLSLQIDMQPVAQLRLPSGFSKIGALPGGSIGFGQHPDGVSVLLGFEKRASVSTHAKGVDTALFFLSIFKGFDSNGCEYLQSYQLESQDYRLHAEFDKGAEIFAYGKGSRHQFYLIRPDKPDFVLRGLFKGVDRTEFESILSSVAID